MPESTALANPDTFIHRVAADEGVQRAAAGLALATIVAGVKAVIVRG